MRLWCSPLCRASVRRDVRLVWRDASRPPEVFSVLLGGSDEGAARDVGELLAQLALRARVAGGAVRPSPLISYQDCHMSVP